MEKKQENWIIKLTYFDGEHANIILPAEEIPKFLEAFKSKKEYWSPQKDAAFMTDAEKVRFINIGKEKIEEDIKEKFEKLKEKKD